MRVLQELPELVSLYMSLFEEETVHLVITSLPRLRYLNGIEIHRKEVLRAEAGHPRSAALPLEQIRETDEDESVTPYNFAQESVVCYEEQGSPPKRSQALARASELFEK